MAYNITVHDTNLWRILRILWTLQSSFSLLGFTCYNTDAETRKKKKKKKPMMLSNAVVDWDGS